MAVQLAKSIGAHVAATASTESRAYVRELGADEVIDYKNEAFEQKLRDLDAVVDTVGGATTEESFKVLKKGGTLVSMLGRPDAGLAQHHGVTAVGQFTHMTIEVLKRLAQLVDDGAVKIRIHKVFPLDQVKEAFELVEKGRPRGKVVLEIKQA